jgi:rhamnose transport system ATP-binding protein
VGETTAGLACSGVNKCFGGVPVLVDVDLAVRPGEIHVLLGENGAGKSTLVKIVAGLVAPDSGAVVLDGHDLTGRSVAAAQSVGVALIHQEPRLFPDLTVLENVWIDEPSRGRFRRSVNLRTLGGRTRQLLDQLGCRVALDARVNSLSVADQQLVDIASALRRELRVLIVDEPTASLTPSEVHVLFGVLRALRDDGVTIIFIGHRLEEIMSIGDRITVLRDGRVVTTLAVADTDEDELIRLMVGRDIESDTFPTDHTNGDVVLSVSALSSPGAFSGVSFEVHRGEVLGIGGLVGAGRTELLETIFGVRRRTHGTVVAAGRRITRNADAIRAGLGLVPEDRGVNGLVVTRPIRENIVAPNMRATSRHGIRRRNRETDLAARLIDRLRIKALGGDQLPNQLSGGNQQKVSVAKWMAHDLSVLLVDEPTRGVDVGAKAEIHNLLRELAAHGTAVVMVSSDMRELLSMSDRILVMREGALTGELHGATADEESVLRLAAGAPGAAA